MKVTAILPDKLIEDVVTFSKGKNITESLKIALSQWTTQQNVNKLIQEVNANHLDLDQTDYSKIRTLNRRQ
jgi:hypothetical protein